MSIEGKVEAIDRDVELSLSSDLTPAAQSATIASFARDQLDEGEKTNAGILGRMPPHTTAVDGITNASEDSVKPQGTIFYEFQLLGDVFKEIADLLQKHAPVGGPGDPHPGLYRSSFTFYADGEEVDVGGEIPADAQEYVFVNTVPYARKIEHGLSPQAPEGVFEAVAALARQRFGNMVKIEFTYRGIVGLSSGSGTLVNPLNDPTRRNKKGQGSKAYNKSDVRFPCIVVTVR